MPSHAVKLEIIEDNVPAFLRSRPRPYVAEIVTIGFGRKFLRGWKDYSEANSIGSRGVYCYYRVESDRLYEVRQNKSWSRTVTYYLVIDKDGTRHHMGREEAKEWLVNSLA